MHFLHNYELFTLNIILKSNEKKKKSKENSG